MAEERNMNADTGRSSGSGTENVREVRGGPGRGRMRGPRPKLDDPMGLFRRLMAYVLQTGFW